MKMCCNIDKEVNNIALDLYMVNTVIINNTVYEIEQCPCSITATVNEYYNWYIVNVHNKCFDEVTPLNQGFGYCYWLWLLPPDNRW